MKEITKSEAKGAAKMKFNRASLKSTLNAAVKSAKGFKAVRYVFANYFGYQIATNKPSFNQQYIEINENGIITKYDYDFPTSTWFKEVIG